MHLSFLRQEIISGSFLNEALSKVWRILSPTNQAAVRRNPQRHSHFLPLNTSSFSKQSLKDTEMNTIEINKITDGVFNVLKSR